MLVLVIYLILALSYFFLVLILRYDSDHGLSLRKQEHLILCIGSVLFAIWILYIVEEQQGAKIVCLSFLAAYLLITSLTDYQTNDVHDFLHVIAAIAGIIMCVLASTDHLLYASLAQFIGMQLLIFSRLYGLGDCLAFMVCAIYLTAQGAGLYEHLIFMASVFCQVTAVQISEHNMNRKGNLIKPIALLPYITVSIFCYYL
jgi:hypothetical protein